RSSIVGEKRKLMPRGQISQDVIRADIAAVLHGEELIGFDPEYSHKRSAVICRRDAGATLYSANPHCLSAGDKVDEGDQGGGIEDNESTGGIGNARERSDLDARKRGQAERVKRQLRPERRAIQRLGQEHGCDEKRQQGKGHGQARELVAYEFKANRVFGTQQPGSKLKELIVAGQGANLAGEFTAFAYVGRVPGAGAGVKDDAKSLAHDLHPHEEVVEDGALGQWRRVEQAAAGAVDGAGGAGDRTGGGLQFANFLFNAPVKPHSLSGLSAGGITQHQFAASGADIEVGEILKQQTQGAGFDLLARVGKQQHLSARQFDRIVEASGFALGYRFQQSSNSGWCAGWQSGIAGIIGENGGRAIAGT